VRVLVAFVAIAIAVGLLAMPDVWSLRRGANLVRSSSLVQTLARAYRNSWRNTHKL
jgi:hypothetical protein